jgi:hypothetical protein
MSKTTNARGGAGAGRRAGSGRAARTDADEAMEDTQAELNDISAALNTPEAAAGESAGGRERPSLPEPLLQRRLDKERLEKKKAIKEKETMQIRMDEMQAQLDLAHSKVGDVVSVASPNLNTPSASKVRLKLLEVYLLV